jgi:hypothetical protein
VPEDVRFQGIAIIGKFSGEMARWLMTPLADMSGLAFLQCNFMF